MSDAPVTDASPDGGIPNEDAPVLTQEQIDAASAAKFDAAQVPVIPENIVNDEVKDRPDYVPEKFWKDNKVDISGLLKGYTELETKLGTPKEPTDATPAADTTPADEVKAAADAALEAKGFNYDDFVTEYTDNEGKLSQETYNKLADAGFDKTVVDNHIAGQIAIGTQQVTELQGMVGGEESYGKMIEWAAVNMTQAEQDAFDTALVSGQEQAKFAITSLQAKYQSANGTDFNPLTTDNVPKISGGYESKEQMLADMKDPKYAKDPAFRAGVQARLKDASFDW